MVYGSSLEATLVGIVVPDPDELCCWVKKTLNIDGTSVGQLSALSEVKQAILEELWTVGKKAGLNSFEQVKDILVTTEMFSIENGQMTPTQKIKRENITAHYAQEINEMYLQLAK
ncbi:hypothetical protein NP493_27g05008 [Ridgeia piscesae]|uniref:Uncharacterized protein n=1 Tax=Ridgeia piscesae TaxID=27915 RepID=A0AAD9PD56_RIDPI|nr:hypothetical protein NP493_27g05008 [Ridgeia piscesae]